MIRPPITPFAFRRVRLPMRSISGAKTKSYGSSFSLFSRLAYSFRSPQGLVPTRSPKRARNAGAFPDCSRTVPDARNQVRRGMALCSRYVHTDVLRSPYTPVTLDRGIAVHDFSLWCWPSPIPCRVPRPLSRKTSTVGFQQFGATANVVKGDVALMLSVTGNLCACTSVCRPE